MIARKAFLMVLVLATAALLSTDNASAKGKKKQDTPPRTSPSFSELDKDMDGRLTLAEFKAGFPNEADVEQKFKSLDTNGDGTLSISEYKAGYPDPIRPPKNQGKHGKQGAAKSDPAQVAKRFAKLDANGDGKLSLDEFKAGKPDPVAAEKKFKSLDKNHDGFLNIEEFQAGFGKPAKKKQP